MDNFFTYVSGSNPVFRTHAFWSSVLLIKILLLGAGTGMKRKVFRYNASRSDAKLKSKGKVNEANEDVERMRRAHFNDLENIFIFIIIGFAYIMTNPHQWLAMTLIKAFAITRILHTLVYAFVEVPQPTRFILFIIGIIINVYMGLTVVRTFL